MNNIFVPFLDGLLNYDCRECGAGCCQSGTIVANKDENRVLNQEYPYIRFFLTGEHNKLYTFRKYPECWFLGDDGSCEIQDKYGYSLKPFICRLHPFYVAKSLDEYVVLPTGCDKLTVTKRGDRSHISHAVVLANAQEAIDCDYVSDGMTWSPEKQGLERQILEESSKFLDHESYLDFAAFQIAAASPNVDLTGIRTRLDETMGLWKSLLGVEELEIDNPTLTFELTALTSLLRVSNRNLQSMTGPQTPVALLALYFGMLLFSAGRHVKRYVETYESVLAGLPLGLASVTEKDAGIKNQPLEKRVRYIRTLGQMYSPGFRKSLKPTGPLTGVAGK